MKAILILAGAYSSCNATELIWKKICKDKGISLTAYNSTHDKGLELSSELNIKSFPALIIDNIVVAVGHPDERSAKKVIANIVK